jgi:hypothetical protein
MVQAAFIRAIAASLIAGLAAGCGGGSGGEVKPQGSGTTPTASKIWVGDSAKAAIGSSANSNPSAGTLVVDRTISGANTQLTTSLFDFALDAANDQLYVADLRNILVFNNAGTASGNVTPRVVSTIGGSFTGYNGGIYLDTANDRLYAGTNASTATQVVQVFDNASFASLVAPDRTITFTARGVIDLVVDTTRDILYAYIVDAGGLTQILVFDHTSALDGTVTPNRTITIGDAGGGASGPIGMFLDATNDRLYVPRNFGPITVFDAVHAANDSVTPSRTITPPGLVTYSVVTLDLAANRLYTVDFNGINIINGASTVNGTPLVTTRATAPAGSKFQAIAVKP